MKMEIMECLRFHLAQPLVAIEVSSVGRYLCVLHECLEMISITGEQQKDASSSIFVAILAYRESVEEYSIRVAKVGRAL